jgi:3-hydroxybutyryl-CoA dehydratase
MDKILFDTIQVGQELSPVIQTVNQETFWKNAVGSFDYNPVHCDPEWVKTAQPFGIPVTVAHGMMTMSFMLTMVTNWAYPSMGKITEIDSKLIRPVQGGWTVNCSGIISEKHVIAPGRNYVIVDLKAENQDGDILAICQATVVFPESN